MFLIGCHPAKSGFTTPLNVNDPDLGSVFMDIFFSNSFAGNGSSGFTFMPGGIINRRVWSNSARMQSTSYWSTYTNTILNENSPVNVGLSATYNSTTQLLDVTVEIYYTGTVTVQNNLNVYITESNIIAEQSNASANYVHKHVFREALTSQWGNQITEPTTQGSLITKNFQFNNSSAQYDMSNCEVIVFITNDGDKEVLSGNGETVTINTNTNKSKTFSFIESKVYPNPVNNNSVIEFDIKSNGPVELQIFDFTGKLISEKNIGYLQQGTYIVPLNKEEMSLIRGMYLLRLKFKNETSLHKLLVY